MVRHMVMWRLRATISEADWTQILEAIAVMRAGIVGLRALEMGVNRSTVADCADIGLYSAFDSWEALRNYEVHPLHQVLKRIIGPIKTDKRVVDYEI